MSARRARRVLVVSAMRQHVDTVPRTASVRRVERRPNIRTNSCYHWRRKAWAAAPVEGDRARVRKRGLDDKADHSVNRMPTHVGRIWKSIRNDHDDRWQAPHLRHVAEDDACL